MRHPLVSGIVRQCFLAIGLAAVAFVVMIGVGSFLAQQQQKLAEQAAAAQAQQQKESTQQQQKLAEQAAAALVERQQALAEQAAPYQQPLVEAPGPPSQPSVAAGRAARRHALVEPSPTLTGEDAYQKSLSEPTVVWESQGQRRSAMPTDTQGGVGSGKPVEAHGGVARVPRVP